MPQIKRVLITDFSRRGQCITCNFSSIRETTQAFKAKTRCSNLPRMTSHDLSCSHPIFPPSKFSKFHVTFIGWWLMVLLQTAFHRDQLPDTRFQIWIRSQLCPPRQLNSDQQGAPHDTSGKVCMCKRDTFLISNLGNCKAPAPVHRDHRTVLPVGVFMLQCSLCLHAFRTKNLVQKHLLLKLLIWESDSEAKLMQTNLFIILQLRPVTQTSSSVSTAKLSFLFALLYLSSYRHLLFLSLCSYKLGRRRRRGKKSPTTKKLKMLGKKKKQQKTNYLNRFLNKVLPFFF